MAGQWKEIVDSSFKINGKELAGGVGITIGKGDIAGLNTDLDNLSSGISTLNGDLSGLNTAIGLKVDKTFKIGDQALTGLKLDLLPASIPSLAISKITGLQTGLDGKVPNTFKIGSQVLSGTSITLLEATIPTLGQAKITGLVADLASKVPTSRKIAGKALTADVSLAKGDVGLGSVDNKSSATIRSEITVDNIPIDIPQAKITGLVDDLNNRLKTNTLINGVGMEGGIGTTPYSFNLNTSDLIPETATLPVSGKQGQMVKQGNQIYIWREDAV